MSGTDLRIRRSWRRLVGAAGLAGGCAGHLADRAGRRGAGRGGHRAAGCQLGRRRRDWRGATFYAGELFSGDIFRGDLQRGTAELFIDAPPGPLALGLKVDDPAGCCSSPAASRRGLRLRRDHRCGRRHLPIRDAGQSIINDVVITQDGAWFTDSVQPKPVSCR